MRNILSDRMKSSDLLWASRVLKPAKTHRNQYTSKNLKQLCDEVYQFIISQGIKEVIVEDECEDKQVTASKIKSILEEICCSYNESLIRCLGVVFSKLLKRYFSGVYVNEEALTKIKRIIGNSPVILLPTHRSYCDFIIMAFIFFTFDIEIPCVAAAIDFSSMKIIGNMLRDCKAFFIRRNFNNDPLYKYIFQRYLQYLVIYGNSPVEFFIEGTRSRTGKALAPKYGLLKTIIDTFVENDVPEVVLLPVAISYDKVLEDRLFSCELLGIPKHPESTKGFFKALATMDENYGNIFLTFGEPMYLKRFLMQYDLSSWSSDSSGILEKLGFHIIKEQQTLQQILCIHLLSLIIFEHFLKKGFSPIEYTSVCNRISLLKILVESFNGSLYLNDDVSISINEVLSVHKTIFTLLDDNTIQLNEIRGHSLNIDHSTSKAAKLHYNIVDDALTLLQLQQYTNPLLCILANPALVVVLIQNYSTLDKLGKKYIFFRRMFCTEFIFVKEDEEKEFWSSINHLLELKVIQSFNGSFKMKKENWLSMALSSLLYPFFVTYLYTCRILKTSSSELPLSNIIKLCQLHIEDRIKTQDVCYHMSLSIDTICQAVNMLVRLQAVSRINRSGCDVYREEDRILLMAIVNEFDNVVMSLDLMWKESNSCLPCVSKL